MTPEEMDRLIEEHMSAEDTGDLDAAVAVYTDDVEHDVVGAPGGPLYGPAAARARYEGLLENMRSGPMVLLRRYHAADACIVEHEVTATIVGQFAGIPGNGREVRFRLLHVFEFSGGLISRENVWMDTVTLMAQLTAPEPVGAAAR